MANPGHIQRDLPKRRQKGKQRSQLGGHLSRTLWQLVHVEVKADVALQAEETAVARLLKDGLCFEFSRLAGKHQQVPIQKPGSTGRQSLATLAVYVVKQCNLTFTSSATSAQ